MIIVTGARGYLGSALLARLSGAHDVVALSRGDPLEQWRELCTDVRVVVHLAAPVAVVDDAATSEAMAVTDRLFAALPDRPIAFVFAGSTSIFATPDVPSVLTESSPLQIFQHHASSADAYARMKRVQEDHVRERCAVRGDFLTVLRPVNVWDAGHPCLHCVGPRLGALWFAVAPRRLLRLIHRDNVVTAFVSAIQNTAAEPYRAFNLDDGAGMTPRTFARLISGSPGRAVVIVPLARGLFDAVMQLGYVFWRMISPQSRVPGLLLQEQRDQRFGPYEVDTSAARRDLAWQPDLAPYGLAPDTP